MDNLKPTKPIIFLDNEYYLDPLCENEVAKSKRGKKMSTLDGLYVESMEFAKDIEELAKLDPSRGNWRILYNKRQKAFDSRDPDPLLYFLEFSIKKGGAKCKKASSMLKTKSSLQKK
jgi:hypothetical protein